MYLDILKVRFLFIFYPFHLTIDAFISASATGYLGKGTQYMPWIHIHDLCGIFKFIIENKHISGIYNAVSPEHITNIELVKKIAKILNRKIIFPNIPGFIIKGLFGERAIMLLEGSRVSSDSIIKNGFNFKYNNIEKALNNLLKSNKQE